MGLNASPDYADERSPAKSQ